MIVIDPVLTDTAKMAELHLRVRPGTDAWCLAALVGVLVEEDLVDHEFLAAHANGADVVMEAFADTPVGEYAARCGVDEELLRSAARRIGTADTVAVFEDLGVQQAPNSTLSSYLNKLLWILTGNFGRPGTQHLHTSLGPLFGSTRVGRTPVTGAPIIGSLMPCNVIPDEILTDHPARFRGLLVESANPAHSLADSARMRAALEALELLVVIDVAMTETARLADYVLPAASQYEKPEATFFNFEFPANTFHVRRPLLEPLEGTLPEPEIHARLVRALNVLDPALLDPLHVAARQGRREYAQAFGEAAQSEPMLIKLAPYVLYETLGPTLPEGLAGAAALWGLAQRCAATYPDAVRRAGYADGDELFDAALAGRSGIVFTLSEYEDDFALIATPDKRLALELPEMLAEVRALRERRPGWTTAEFPLVLSAGERRSYTANTIYRDPAWRKRGADGALRLSPQDAAEHGVTDGDRVRISTARGSATVTVEVTDAMQPGHASLPNGFGLDYTDADGNVVVSGAAPNSLTSSAWRDEFAGTPWHKHVPARVEALA
jgi:formate dehydrogenase